MFPIINNIRMDALPRLTPGISNAHIYSDQGIRNLVVFDEDSGGPCVLLGKIAETTTGADCSNTNVWLEVSRPRVGLVFGRRGSGKSYDLGVILEGLASLNTKLKVGKYRPPIVVFDPLNQFWTLQDEPGTGDIEDAHQIDELTKWGLKPTSLSNIQILLPLGTPKRHPNAKDFCLHIPSINIDDWCGFFQVSKYTDPMGQLLSTVYDKVTKSGYKNTKNEDISSNENYNINELINCIQEDTDINDPHRGFHINTIRAVVSRLSELRRNPLFSGLSELKISDIFSSSTISIFMLRDVDEATRGVIVSQIVKKIVKARAIGRDGEELARRIRERASRLADGTEKTKLMEHALSLEENAQKNGVSSGWIVLDEAHTLCPSSGESASRDVLVELAKQGRHLGLSLLAATQQPSALSTKLCSQRDYIILHNLGIKQDVDAGLALVNPNFPSSIGSGRDQITTGIASQLLNSLGRGEAIFSVDEINRNFMIKIRPRATAHGGKEPFFI